MQVSAILAGAVIPLEIDVTVGDVVLQGPEEAKMTQWGAFILPSFLATMMTISRLVTYSGTSFESL